VYGNKLYNQVNTDIEGFYRAFNITERVANNHWTGEGSTNEFPRLSWTGASNNKQPSDSLPGDGSYLRLKNLQLGYTFGEKLSEPAARGIGAPLRQHPESTDVHQVHRPRP
jgi:hypothetical protein